MRQFVPSDYVDKKGNVYDTVGENIREGKNGAVTSDFPTPEEIGSGGLIGSDGSKYVKKLSNLGEISYPNSFLSVLCKENYELEWQPIPSEITEENKGAYDPLAIKGVVDYVEKKIIIPTNFKKYNVSFSVNAGNITLNNLDNIPDFNVKLISGHFVVKSSLNISFIEITSFTPLAPEVVVLDTQIYFDETKLSARINTNKDGNYSLLLIAG